MMALDLVITIDSFPAHLAGALGIPVWTLLTYSPDRRWHHEESTTPRYPTMRLFREKRPGDWESVVCAMLEVLEGRNHIQGTWPFFTAMGK